MTGSRFKKYKFNMPFRVRKWFAPVDKPEYFIPPRLTQFLLATTPGLLDVIMREEQETAGLVNGDGFWYLPDKKDMLRPLIVAHVDTVCSPFPPHTLRLEDEMLYSPDSILGADDRAGVYAALELRARTGVGVLLCDEEERGAHGARAAGRTIGELIQCHPYMIELDRQGHRQVVYYRNECDAFKQHMSSYGFIKEYGSFSDISVLSNMLDVPGANVSIGFHYQHSKNEWLDLRTLDDTIMRVTKIIEDNKVVVITPVVSKYTTCGKYTYIDRFRPAHDARAEYERRFADAFNKVAREQEEETKVEEEVIIPEVDDPADDITLTDEQIDHLTALQVERLESERLAYLEKESLRAEDGFREQGDDPEKLYEWWCGG